MILANFTPDDIFWTFGGISGTIVANGAKGAIVNFDEAKANHILTKFGSRGLIKMEYSTEPGYLERRKAESMKVYRRFWERDLMIFNEHNAGLKNEGKAYVRPGRQREQKAKELGLEMVSAWKTVAPREDSTKISALKAEMQELKNMIKGLVGAKPDDDIADTKPEDLDVVIDPHMGVEAKKPQKDEIIELEDLVQERVGEDVPEIIEPLIVETDTPDDGLPDDGPPDWDAVLNSFAMLNKKSLTNYHEKHRHMVPTWPKELQNAYMDRYKNLFGVEPEI